MAICTKCRATMTDGVAETLKDHVLVAANGDDGLCSYHRKFEQTRDVYAKAQEADPWPPEDYPKDDPNWVREVREEMGREMGG